MPHIVPLKNQKIFKKFQKISKKYFSKKLQKISKFQKNFLKKESKKIISKIFKKKFKKNISYLNKGKSLNVFGEQSNNVENKLPNLFSYATLNPFINRPKTSWNSSINSFNIIILNYSN